MQCILHELLERILQDPRLKCIQCNILDNKAILAEILQESIKNCGFLKQGGIECYLNEHLA